MSGTGLLTATDVTVAFDEFVAVQGASLTAVKGEITALIGPNGAGKSTFFNVLTGFCRAQRGEILFEGRSVAGAPPHQLCRAGLVRSFQLSKALPSLSVIENLVLAYQGHPGERVIGALTRPLRSRRVEADARARALSVLKKLGLERMVDARAGQLSGGQGKLLEMARTLMTDPSLVLLDEPFAGVAPPLRDSLAEHIRSLRDEGLSFVIIEHDLDRLLRLADSVTVMAAGRTIARGRPDEIRSDPAVIDGYLGA